MNGDIIQFVFMLISHMLNWCHADTLEEAIGMAVNSINEVIDRHNKAVRAVRSGATACYHVASYGGHDGGYLTDNQCVLLSMLRADTTYTRISSHLVDTLTPPST